MKKVGITGATGFIGGNLAKALLNNADEIKCLVRNTSTTDNIKHDKVTFVPGDLENGESLNELVSGCDTVFHLAAFVSDWGARDDFMKINYHATKNLLSSSIDGRVKKFVYLSTSSVLWKSDFWNVHNLIDIDESYPYPSSYNDYYNESKALAEKLVIDYNGRAGLETVVIRPSGVWGAGDTVILPRIISAATKGFLIPAGNGRGIVSPCHVENLVNAMTDAAVTKESSGKIYFINDGYSVNHIDFIKKLLHSSGIEWEPKFLIPYKAGYLIAAIIELSHKILRIQRPPVISRFAVSAIAGSRTYSISNAIKDFKYSPIINMDEGLKQLSKWVAQKGGYEYLLNRI